jgi:hypothetical protein
MCNWQELLCKRQQFIINSLKNSQLYKTHSRGTITEWRNFLNKMTVSGRILGTKDVVRFSPPVYSKQLYVSIFELLGNILLQPPNIHIIEFPFG